MFPNQYTPGTYPQLTGYNPSTTTGNNPMGYPQIQSLSSIGTPQPAPQPQPAVKPLIGRVVANPDEILLNDVPQDNTIALFPMQDYSCILAKQWNKDGHGIDTIRYVPVVENQQPEETGITLDQIMNEISSIKDMLKNPPRNNYHKQKNYKYDKERNSKVENTETEVN